MVPGRGRAGQSWQLAGRNSTNGTAGIQWLWSSWWMNCKHCFVPLSLRSLCGFGLLLANGRWSPWPGMTLCILKLVVMSFAGWFYHPLSEEDMEVFFILVCQFKLGKIPSFCPWQGGGKAAHLAGDTWAASWREPKALGLTCKIMRPIWHPHTMLFIQCGLAGLPSMTGKPWGGVAEAGVVVVVVGSLAFPVGTFSFAMNLLDSWQVRSVDLSGHTVVSV